MMYKLILVDGTIYDVGQDSNATNFYIPVGTLAEAQEVIDEITIENCKTVIIKDENDVVLSEDYNIIPVSYQINRNYGDTDDIMIHFTNRVKTDNEIINDQITELQEAVSELAEALA